MRAFYNSALLNKNQVRSALRGLSKLIFLNRQENLRADLMSHDLTPPFKVFHTFSLLDIVVEKKEKGQKSEEQDGESECGTGAIKYLLRFVPDFCETGTSL
jgi:hypothetical protein